jgi:hypothetical protein
LTLVFKVAALLVQLLEALSVLLYNASVFSFAGLTPELPE